VTQRQPRHVVGVTVSILVTVVVFVVLVLGVRAEKGLGYNPAAARATTGANIALSVLPDSMVCHGGGGGPHADWVTYCPSTAIKVPAYSTITVTIKQYDSGGSVHNPFFAQVKGTVGNVMLVNGRPAKSVSWEDVAHTFTIQTPPNLKQTQLFINVPLPGVSEKTPENVTINGHKYQSPNIVVFKFKTGAPGSYVWHCYVPCGEGLAGEGLGGQEGFGGPMATTGYMSGTLTVT